MKQIVQSISGGPVRVVDVPRPTIKATEVLVQTIATAISPGTEKAVTQLARAGLFAKARARPDLVRQVIRKVKTEGIQQSVRAVRTRLQEDLALGYSGCGIALEAGEAVANISPGQLVATSGAGKACHAEFQSVSGLLCAAVPEGVTPESAAFATIASIALHATRLAEVGPGSKVGVVGLGLIGQLAIRLVRAAGCDVAGIDVASYPVDRARRSGAFALTDEGDDTTKAVLEWSRGRGLDAILMTAGGAASDAIMRTPSIARDRAVIVVVGDVGLDLQRTPFYEKELTLRFARSYGPGRYERSYEDWGVDYPHAYVRWTVGRNLEAVLDLMASGALTVDDLITHRFGIEEGAAAYELIDGAREPYLGILLTYTPAREQEKPVQLSPKLPPNRLGIGLIGAGSFASSVLVPAMKRAGFDRFIAVGSASGLSAMRLAERAGFQKAVSGAESVIEDPDVDVVVVTTPHDLHASLTVQALKRGKHVFCEKPLALTVEELEEVEAAVNKADGILFVGFNRRWSKAIAMVKEYLAGRSGPLVINYRVNAGPVAESHWLKDRRQGGRLLGEVCHFIDTCSALTNGPVTSVHASASGSGERLLVENIVVSLAYRDGSLATIQYSADGDPTTEKERIDVMGRGRSATVVDFRAVILGSKTRNLRSQDKGHNQEMEAFRRALEGRTRTPRYAIESTRTTLLAACNLC